jgi:hypothetical protein
VEQPVVLSPDPVPAATPAPVVTPPPATPPTPTTARVRPEKKAVPVARDTGQRTEEKRRWGLTALILVLGGGAAAAHGRRHR